MTKLYWVHDENCNNPFEDGYIGITDIPLKDRHAVHLRRRVAHAETVITEMFEGTRNECKQWEFAFRPTPDIGWNKAIGGHAGGMLFRKHSPETRAIMSLKRLAYHATHEFKQTESAKAAISLAGKGRKKPAGHAEKLRAIAKRRFRVTKDDGSWTWGYRQNE